VLVRRAHEERVLTVLRERRGLSRAELAARVGLSRTTMSEITSDLLARGVLMVVDTDAGRRTGRGRRADLLALDPASGQFLGVDFGHHRVRVAVADGAHEVIGEGARDYPLQALWPQRLKAAFDLVEGVASEQKISLRALQGIGVGLVGPRPTPLGGEPDDVRVTVRKTFGERFGAPVVVDNNTRFAAVAEALASGGAGDVLYIRLAHGVGGGLVIGGRLVGGARGVAGEFGHVRAVPGGHKCRCGKRGCLETVASLPALRARCRELGAPDVAAERLDGTDPVVAAVLAEAADAVARVVADAAVVLNPAEMVVGGTVPRLAPSLVAQVAERVAAELVPIAGSPPVVRGARLGDDDGALGAIAVLFQEQSQLLAEYAGPAVASRV
jgi:predicted NBD/HSP70 family sugar kinase